MCRLFGQLTPGAETAARYLADSDFSLLRQSHAAPDNQQKDGWGIAWFRDGEAVVAKSPGFAFREKDAFGNSARAAVSNAVVGHIRAASNPRGIPDAQLITLDNTQPFTDGRWAFGHNGTLNIPLEVAEELGPLKSKLKAQNDSEVYFWQWVKHAERLGDPVKAFAACVEEDWRLWERCKGAHPDKKTPYTGLNTVVSDGSSLYALCHKASSGLAAHAIFTPGQPWQIMSYALRAGGVVVGSEPLDAQPDWKTLGPDATLAARLEDGKAVCRIQPFTPEIPALRGGRS